MRWQPRAARRTNRAALALALGLSVGAALADQPERFGDWDLLRLPQAGCQLTQTVISRRSGTRIAEIWLAGQPDGSSVLSARVPVGVSLPEGIAYRHPSARRAVPLTWQLCGPETCLAQARITEEETARLKRGSRIVLAFVPVRGSRPLQVAVSLRGVTAGLRAVAACSPP